MICVSITLKKIANFGIFFILSGRLADTNVLHRSIAEVASLEDPEENLQQTTLQLEIAYLADPLRRQRRQYACFHVNVVYLENAVLRQYA
jgi:hypothetical protein